MTLDDSVVVYLGQSFDGLFCEKLDFWGHYRMCMVSVMSGVCLKF